MSSLLSSPVAESLLSNLMDEWDRGRRQFAGEVITEGVYDIMLVVVDNIYAKNPSYGPFDYEMLLARLQFEFNRQSIRRSFDPAASQAGATGSRPSKRPSSEDSTGGPSPAKQSRRDSTLLLFSDVEPTSSEEEGEQQATGTPQGQSPHPVVPSTAQVPVQPQPGPAPIPVQVQPQPQPHRYLIYRRRTHAPERYSEPPKADWGPAGSEAARLAALRPRRHRVQPRMRACSRCDCTLTTLVDHSHQEPALCVLCGTYKERNVSTLILLSLF